jgi:hypothetical protein
MTSVPVRVLTQDLLDRNEWCLGCLDQLSPVPWEKLCTAPASGKWSAAECLHHLQKYHDYYVLLVQETLIDTNLWRTHDTVYKATWSGDWFASSMLVGQNGKTRRMKSPYNKRPNLSEVPNTIVADFGKNLIMLKEICARADKYNLNRKTIPVAILPLIKINLGDALRLVIYHNQRHLGQALAAVL